MRTNQTISSLIGVILELLDETLFEQITFGADQYAVQVFGEKGAGVAGPVWKYSVTLGGKVKFSGGGRTSFIWDEVELQKDCLVVKCGPHMHEHRNPLSGNGSIFIGSPTSSSLPSSFFTRRALPK